MFVVNDDLSIYVTRGDEAFFSVSADDNGEPFVFRAGDVVRFKVFGKKDAENVVLQKDFAVTDDAVSVEVTLSGKDTRIGDTISKPVDYWYEVEVNPDTNPQTIIGYDEDGAKVFRLFPEGKEAEIPEPDPEDFPVVDPELDLTSHRPVENQAVTRAILQLESKVKPSIPSFRFGTKDFADVALNVKTTIVEMDDSALVVPESEYGGNYYEDITGGLMLHVGNGYSSVRFDFYGNGATGKYIVYGDGDSSGLYIETNVSNISGKFQIAYVKVDNEGISYEYDYESGETKAEVKYFGLTPLDGAIIS